MKSFMLALVASLAAQSSATFVVQCYSRLFDQRADPVVNPGAPSGHVHTISGGSGFNFSMTYEQARASKCSTCNIKQDNSNYWSPKLYFRAKNGSFISVPIIGDNGANMGGMAIYYLTRSGPDNDKLRAFPPGFRMVAGTSSKRVETDDFAGRAVTHKCVGADGPDGKGLPKRKCDQIRVQVTFPACWDGKNVDSPDHKSHVSYPRDGNYDGGRCPKSHPVHLVTLFYEVYYDTKRFENEWYGPQPFVFANGDTTGYGYHGDFLNGWDTPTLQKALDNCVDGTPNCPQQVFGEFRSQGEAQACKLPNMIPEQTNGILDALPGCNPPTSGPAPATPVQNCAVPKILAATSAEALGFADLTKSKGFKYIGCGIDNAGSRTLNKAQTWGQDMTITKCVDFCKSKGTKFAGLVYGSECYCGDAVDKSRMPQPGVAGGCTMKCAGDKKTNCGGPDAISLYQTCSGSACVNLDGQARRAKRGFLGA